MARKKDQLLPKQRLFVERYLTHFNATRAAVEAGYSKRSAFIIGFENIRKPNIAAEIEVRKQQLLDAARVQAHEAWQELANIAKSDIGDIMDFDGPEPRMKPANEIPEHARRAIKSMKVKRYVEGHDEDAKVVEITEFALWDKPSQVLAALKMCGELKERTVVSGDPDNPIQHELTVKLPDTDSAEFKALPAGERLRIIREALSATN